MKALLTNIILSSYLFSIGGIIIFNDGTTIEGNIKSVSLEAINIIPMGLTFAEDIRIENVDSLKLDDGNIIIIKLSGQTSTNVLNEFACFEELGKIRCQNEDSKWW